MKIFGIAISILLMLGASAFAGRFGFLQKNPIRVAGNAAPTLSPTGKPIRIVSTENSVNEILIDLVGPERIVALSKDADNPGLCNEIERMSKIPGRVDGTPILSEQVLALDPDLVFVGSACPPETLALLKIGRAPVVRINRGYSILEIQENIRTIGEAVGEPERAGRVIAEMDRRLGVVREHVSGAPPPRTLYIGSGNGYTAGIDTYTDELIQAAGGRNVAREAGVKQWGRISLETVIEMNPDIIFVPDTAGREHGAVGARTVVPTKELARDPLWRDVRAVREGRVYALAPRLLLCNSHNNVLAAEAMARILHPARYPASGESTR